MINFKLINTIQSDQIKSRRRIREYAGIRRNKDTTNGLWDTTISENELNF